MNRSTLTIRSVFRQRGLTLVEIMIAMALSLILLLGVSQIFIGAKTSYNLQEGVSRVQESGRFAMDFIRADMRMAGYTGCAQDTPYTSTLNAGTVDYSQGIIGFESGSGTLPAGVNPVAGTDVVVMRYAKPTGLFLTTGMPETSADLKVTPVTPRPVKDGDVLTVTDCSHTTAFQMTQYNETGTGHNVVHNTGSGTPGNSTKNLGHGYSEGAEILKMTSVAYYIAANTDGSNTRSLYRKEETGNAQELVRGVESMQIMYGLDTDGDGTADQYQNAAGVADWNQVVSIQTAMLVSSVDPARTETDTATYTLLDASVDPADTRELRHVFGSTIALRNRILRKQP